MQQTPREGAERESTRQAAAEARLQQLADEFERMKVELERVMSDASALQRVNTQLRIRSKNKYYQLRSAVRLLY